MILVPSERSMRLVVSINKKVRKHSSRPSKTANTTKSNPSTPRDSRLELMITLSITC